MTMLGSPPTTSRAVERVVQPGTLAYCAHESCGEPIGFRAKTQQVQVICNVYVEGRWDHVEHWHLRCYGKAGKPHGEADSSQRLPMTAGMRRALARSIEDD